MITGLHARAAEPSAAASEAAALNLLRSAQLFAGVPEAALRAVAPRLRLKRFAAGEIILREGDAGDACYLIRVGRAGVVSHDQIGQEVTLATFHAGASFGEMALMAEGKRTATVRALESIEVYALDRAEFLRLERSYPAFGTHVRQHVKLLAIDGFLRRASPFAHLPDKVIRRLAGRMLEERIAPGEVIIREGDVGDRFYLVQVGRVEVLKGGRRVQVLEAGDCFGEAAPLAHVKRTATVRALEDTALLSLDSVSFTSVVADHPILERQFREFVRIRVGEGLAQSMATTHPLRVLTDSLVHRRGPRFWWGLMSGIAAFAGLSALAATLDSPALTFATLLVGSLIGPLIYVTYLADSHLLPDPPIHLAVTFLLAAALGIPIAILLETALAGNSGALDMPVVVAVVEEAAKLAGVAWLLRRSVARFEMDGLIYGAAAGMGFAALENALYGLGRLDSTELFLTTLWVRALLSPFSHGTWTAIVCAVWWKCRRESGPLHTLWAGLAFVTAVALHALWNWQPLRGPELLLWFLGIGLAGLLVLGLILERARREEHSAVVALNPQLSRRGAGSARSTCQACRHAAPHGTHYCARCGAALRRAG